MSDLGILFGGLTGKTKNDFAAGNAKFISYTNVFNHSSVDLDADDRVRIDPNEHQNALRYGDILFTGSSETRPEAAMSSAVTRIPNEPTYLNSFCIAFRPNDPDTIRPEFARYLFRSSMLRRELIRTANGVTRFNVSKLLLQRVKVPVPPVGLQLSIASVLSSFDSLVNDLSFGLPAELAARRKQYEYYRDRLLTFKEAA